MATSKRASKKTTTAASNVIYFVANMNPDNTFTMFSSWNSENAANATLKELQTEYPRCKTFFIIGQVSL